MKGATIVLSAFVLALSAESQEHHGHHGQPYAGLDGREIKALSAEEVEQLRAGAGMGLAKAAELNHYPGPKHVLEHADELGLTNEQRDETRRVFDRMKADAMKLGERIVEGERHLEQAFADGSIDRDTLRGIVSHLASLQGDLRAVHLGAHLEMKRILTAEQVGAYDRLRGYTKGEE